LQGWLITSDDSVPDGQGSQTKIQPLVESLTTGLGILNKKPSVLNEKLSELLETLKSLLNKGTEDAKETVLLAKVKGTLSQESLKGENSKSSHNSNISFGSITNSLTANAAEGKIATTPVLEQIASALREQVPNGQQTMKELSLQLHPAELGKIQIALRWANGQVHLQIQASEAATVQLLQNQLTQLRQTLTDQGVNCGTLQMGQDAEQQKNPRGNDHQSALNKNSLQDKNEDIITVLNQLSLGEDESNRINVMA
jgi:flagellar hook-length control protein FliK